MDENKDILNNHGEAPEDVLEEAPEAIAEEEKTADEAVSEADEVTAEETEEVVIESPEETIGETEEIAVESPEEVDGETEEASAEETGEINEESEENAEEPADAEAPKKKRFVGPLIIIAAGVIVLAAVLFFGFKMTYNPYNHMGYINVSGKTVGELAEEYGMTLEEFLAEYDLPSDMRADTEEAAASYMIPISNIIASYANYGMDIDFETFAEYYGFDESVTPDTPIGEALDSLTLADRIGEENLEEFIKEYELGDKVTGETKWGEVRRKVDKISYEKMLQEEAEAATAEDIVSDEATEDVTE